MLFVKYVCFCKKYIICLANIRIYNLYILYIKNIKICFVS